MISVFHSLFFISRLFFIYALLNYLLSSKVNVVKESLDIFQYIEFTSLNCKNYCTVCAAMDCLPRKTDLNCRCSTNTCKVTE